MKETIDWMIEMEIDLAALFAAGAEFFASDGEFSRFLSLHAEDQKQHIRMIRNVLRYLEEKGDFPSDYTLNEKKQADMLGILEECKERMRSGSITKTEMLEAVIRAELSEFNPFLLYAVALIKEQDDGFSPGILDMPGHLNELKQFAEQQEGSANIVRLIGEFPKVWHAKMLIVEECDTMKKLFVNLFESDQLIECTSDASEALRMIRQADYAVIISEVKLASLNGIDFYKKAAENHPGIGERFLFITSDDSPENIRFFKENSLRYLIKPVFIKDMRQTVDDMLARRKSALPARRLDGSAASFGN